MDRSQLLRMWKQELARVLREQMNELEMKQVSLDRAIAREQAMKREDT